MSSPTTPQLIVVRHGRTTLNREGRLQGRVDTELDDEGRAQADAIAAALADVSISRIVSSPLRRAFQTAEPLRVAAGIESVDIDERWIELSYGEFDGQLLADVPGEVWASWRSSLDFAPPGGESLRTLGERVRGGADDLLAELAASSGAVAGLASGSGGAGRGGSIVVFTHVSPIKAALAWGLGVSDDIAWRSFVGQASITRFGIGRSAVAGGPPVPSLLAFNQDHHLQ